MKTIKVITEEELKEKLKETTGIISDELCELCAELIRRIEKVGLPPHVINETGERDKWDIWEEKLKYFALQDKYEKIIYNKVYEFLKEKKYF